MLDFQTEKEIDLTTQDIHDVLSFAQQAASKGDFFNSFVFERAVWVYAAIMLLPEKKEEIRALAVENVLNAYYTLLKDGILEKMYGDFESTMKAITRFAESWYEESAEHLCSPRGLLNSFDNFSEDVMQSLAQQFQDVLNDENVKALEEFNKKWA